MAKPRAHPAYGPQRRTKNSRNASQRPEHPDVVGLDGIQTMPTSDHPPKTSTPAIRASLGECGAEHSCCTTGVVGSEHKACCIDSCWPDRHTGRTAIAKSSKRRGAPRIDLGAENLILSSLPADDYKRLLPKLERVKLTRGDLVYRANRKIEAVYFPEDAVVTMVDALNDQRTVEVATIGREGMVGINIFLGGAVSPDQAIVQLSGSAIRMSAQDFRHDKTVGVPLQRLLLAYSRALLAVISQSVACSQHHTIQQRLARWLLTFRDYTGGGEFVMLQSSMAAMLGARREGITEAAQKLQSASLIRYCRGRIRVLDGPGLGRRSCECYRFISRQYAGLELP
jgi:CRP-like cAMP-binding protein